MSWWTVARKDVLDDVRSRALWVTTGIFVFFMASVAIAYPQLKQAGGAVGNLDVLQLVLGPVVLVVPLAAIVLGYRSIAGERESGSLRLLLSLPHERTDVVMGKILGRVVVLVVPVAVGFAVAAAILLAVASVDLVRFALLGVLTLVLAMAYTAIAVGLSALSPTSSRAASLAILFWVSFELLWDVVTTGLAFVANGFRLPGPGYVTPHWVRLVGELAPGSAFSQATKLVLPGAPSAASLPVYLQPWFGLVILGVWIVAVPAFGTWRFLQADL